MSPTRHPARQMKGLQRELSLHFCLFTWHTWPWSQGFGWQGFVTSRAVVFTVLSPAHHITSLAYTSAKYTHTQTAINETTSVISVVSYQDKAPVTCTAACVHQQPQVDTRPPQQSLTLSCSCPDTLIAASSNPTYHIMQHLLIFSNRFHTETCQHNNVYTYSLYTGTISWLLDRCSKAWCASYTLSLSTSKAGNGEYLRNKKQETLHLQHRKTQNPINLEYSSYYWIQGIEVKDVYLEQEWSPWYEAVRWVLASTVCSHARLPCLPPLNSCGTSPWADSWSLNRRTVHCSPGDRGLRL